MKTEEIKSGGERREEGTPARMDKVLRPCLRSTKTKHMLARTMHSSIPVRVAPTEWLAADQKQCAAAFEA